MNEIDEIVLIHDNRGISQLSKYVETNSYLKAAEFVIDNKGKVFIVTGFYVNGYPETDGPSGSIILAGALRYLGCNVSIISDLNCVSIMAKVLEGEINLIEFPIMDHIDFNGEVWVYCSKQIQKYARC